MMPAVKLSDFCFEVLFVHVSTVSLLITGAVDEISVICNFYVAML